jgi:hypothetical protein
LLKGYRAAFINPNSALLGPKFKFERHGQCGMELSELLPHTAGIADEICLIRSVQTDAVNHAPGQILMNTGSQQLVGPVLGPGHCMPGSECEDQVVSDQFESNWGAITAVASCRRCVGAVSQRGRSVLYSPARAGSTMRRRASLDTCSS